MVVLGQSWVPRPSIPVMHTGRKHRAACRKVRGTSVGMTRVDCGDHIRCASFGRLAHPPRQPEVR
jgi:hypothetical protein